MVTLKVVPEQAAPEEYLEIRTTPYQRIRGLL
jgi:hypothetical protein